VKLPWTTANLLLALTATVSILYLAGLAIVPSVFLVLDVRWFMIVARLLLVRMVASVLLPPPVLLATVALLGLTSIVLSVRFFSLVFFCEYADFSAILLFLLHRFL